ncbi:MAG: Uma2 family endonuclease [Lyngbya sp. HA4199-MV5]|nr:Uma2 family endonuclease [Lyngbya sp. HA4199-MV5]
MPTLQSALTLEEFLDRPETKPATEFIHGESIQKPMPQGEHSRLQGKLCEVINQVAEPTQIAYALPELRCTFGGASIVPDVAVFRWARIPIQPSGRIVNRFTIHPDWAIEVLSPHQNQTKVLANLLHCVQHGTELGWLLDPESETSLVVFPGQRVELFHGSTPLPVLSEIALTLTTEQVFGWLTLR